MTDNELLLAISDIVGSHIAPLKEDIAELKEKVSSLEDKVSSLEEKVSSLEDKVSSLEDKVSSLEDKVSSLEGKVSSLEGKVSSLERKVSSLEEKVSSLEENVSILNKKTHHIELTLENNVLPRLQNIECCYTSTYHRYSCGIDQLETMQSDIDVMKIVVAEHSKKIENWHKKFT